ncbi:hypothetical protein Mgra_00005295 [Meloidogyne graminicola]|uniref:Uncharacterized protein n=1 Tax=Meloidogyne graminicola TaxID=189291 RepID=A0A8S9ZQB5_9BILA|nr:hypothetical protein Mgra_00005295 [Meloidogyne graminicola]
MEEDEETFGYWKTKLMELQEKAPKPIMVICQHKIIDKPYFYGKEFHGFIDRDEAEKLISVVGEGAYLVRASRRSEDAFTLHVVFDGVVNNYKLFYDGAHYIGTKRYDSIETLVEDGLISMYVEKHASNYINSMANEAVYELSPYSHYHRAPELYNKQRQTPPRCHNFNSFTFKMPHYCDFCRNFLWGIVQQGVRCLDCGFSAHLKCSEKSRPDCRPEAKYIKRMFAVDLTTLCLAHNVRVPTPLLNCIDEIERRGINTEGIYRVSGSFERIDKLRRLYDLSHNVDLRLEEDIHTVAGLLKLYLRLLPQQLVPFSVFRALLKSYTNSIDHLERIRNCRNALDELNEANKDTLRTLLTHLRKIASNSNENKMSAENLSTIFSPTIFCTGNFPFPVLPNQQHVLLNFLITNKNILGPC